MPNAGPFTVLTRSQENENNEGAGLRDAVTYAVTHSHTRTDVKVPAEEGACFSVGSMSSQR